jgi:type I restriction enzyme, S subunit
MKYGLSEKQLQEIKDVLASYEAVEAAVLFGSRAIDTYKEASDIDIVIKGEQADFMLAAKIKGHFEDETYLPFFFDIISYNSIDNDELKKHIKTKGKILYRKGWRTCTLGDVAQLSKNAWKMGDESLPYIGLEHIDENKLRLNGFGFSDDITSNKYHFNQDSFLFGKLRPYFRKLIKPKFQGICSTDIWVVKPTENNDLNYIFYLFSTEEFIDLSYSGSSGTRMPRADWNFMKETSWEIPPLPEQKAIGEVLSSLDDKIDLLHRQNKTLESLAETLFRHHFIDNAQDDWEEKPLSYFVEIVCGKTPSKKKHEYFEGYIPFIKIPDMHGKAFISSTTDTLTEEGKASQINKTLPPLSICVSCIATVGLVSMNIVESQTNQQINSIIPNKDIYRYFLYILMKNSTDLLIAMASGGTATLNLNTGNFSTIPVQSPPEKLLEKFNEEVKPMFEKILSNTKQIQTLEKLRDTLLPKLISGDVRVQYKEVA